jgi:D-amino-acid dehydrogenase
MKVCVVGAGVVGITTAYSLARRGYDVTVVDAAAGPARGASHANGGQLSYAYVSPLADPSIWRDLPKYLFSPESPLTFRPQFDVAQWRWLARFLFACNSRAKEHAVRSLLNLSMFSRDCLEALRHDISVDFELRTAGKLIMHTSGAALDGARKQVDTMAGYGIEQRVLTAEECVAMEPALAASCARWSGGIYTASEQVGDCALFCQQLPGKLMERYPTLRFEYNRSITSAVVRAGRVRALTGKDGDIEADAFVLANGTGSSTLASALGFELPVYPLKGYSITFDIPSSETGVPSVSVTDLRKKIVYARLGNKLRVAGRLEIVGNDLRADEATLRKLSATATQLFPALENHPPATQGWTGLRPATPTGIPIIGKGPISNLYLNVGHGALGWTLACGSAEMLAATINAEPLTLDSNAFMF